MASRQRTLEWRSDSPRGKDLVGEGQGREEDVQSGKRQVSVGGVMRGSWVTLAGWAGTGDGVAATGSEGETLGSTELLGLPSQARPRPSHSRAVLPVPRMAGGREAGSAVPPQVSQVPAEGRDRF